jgi:hypothetical protein
MCRHGGECTAGDRRPSPEGRLAELPSGRVAEVVEVVDAVPHGRMFTAITLRAGENRSVRAEHVDWIDGV